VTILRDFCHFEEIDGGSDPVCCGEIMQWDNQEKRWFCPKCDRTI